MSDERRDDEILGRALARAIETIDVNETPFERSRLATAPARRSVFGLWQIASAAAAIVLALAIGSWLTRPSESGPVAGSPSPAAATATPTQTAVPVQSVAPNRDQIWVYFARDGLPPVGAYIDGTSASSPESRISSRIGALRAATPDKVPAGATNPLSRVAPLRSNTSSFGLSVSVRGDLATVDFDIPTGWGVSGSAQSLALVQQLVYTVTQEPGVHRALITQKGGTAVIDQLVVDRPLTREGVFGYSFAAVPDKIEDGGIGAVGEIADWRASVDQVSPGLGRFVIEFKPQPGAPANSTPRFTAQLERPASEKREEDGKWLIRVSLPDGLWNQPPGEAFHCCPLKVVGQTPIIEATANPLTTDPPVNGIYKGVGFALVLDDARPWRAMVLQNPTRLVIDVGGTPQYVSDRIAFYSMQPGGASNSTVISGAARVFEANVVWRVKDRTGKVVANGHFLASLGSSAVWGTFNATVQLPASLTGSATLELFEVSPKDGSEQGLVQIPLGVR